MITIRINALRGLVFGLAALACTSNLFALPGDPNMTIQFVPQLTITGEIGSTVQIKAADALQSKSTTWTILATFVLTQSPYFWYDTNSPLKQRSYQAMVQPVVRPPAPAGFVWVSGGRFTMGSPATEQARTSAEGPQTEVTLTKGFYLGQHEVTQGEYRVVIGSSPSAFTGDTNLPVEQVSWYEATNYCGQLTARERTAGRISTNWAYRLPTEAEWEYACRAGTTNRFYYGDDPTYSLLGNYAWYVMNSGSTTHPVGQKQPNPWGLRDMSGNVWEWCSDWDGDYPGGSVSDPTGPTSGSWRVIRGGGWLAVSMNCRSAYHNNASSSFSSSDIGFRVVLAACQP
jgi:formylglycine-generating enzyme required for sulfatase activity